MSGRPWLAASLLLLGSACATLHAAEPQQLTWGLTAWPGLVNNQDGQPTDGLVIDLLGEITRRMPDYEHHLQLMNTSRSLADLEQRSDLCIVDVQRNPERDRIGYFVGLFINLPPQLVIRKSDRLKISRGLDSISLEQLLQRSELRGALPAGRIYGAELTPLIETAEARGRIQRVQSSGRGSNLLDMLERGRIDYTLEYAETLQMLRAEPGMQPLLHSLSLLPVNETVTPIISGVYCSRSNVGRQAVREIDRIAGDPEVLAAFAAAMESFTSAETRKHYQLWYDDYLGNRASRSYTNLDD